MAIAYDPTRSALADYAKVRPGLDPTAEYESTFVLAQRRVAILRQSQAASAKGK